MRSSQRPAHLWKLPEANVSTYTTTSFPAAVNAFEATMPLTERQHRSQNRSQRSVAASSAIAKNSPSKTKMTPPHTRIRYPAKQLHLTTLSIHRSKETNSKSSQITISTSFLQHNTISTPHAPSRTPPKLPHPLPVTPTITQPKQPPLLMHSSQLNRYNASLLLLSPCQQQHQHTLHLTLHHLLQHLLHHRLPRAYIHASKSFMTTSSRYMKCHSPVFFHLAAA